MLKKKRLVALASLGLVLGYVALQASNGENHVNNEINDKYPSTIANPVDQNKQIDMKSYQKLLVTLLGVIYNHLAYLLI